MYTAFADDMPTLAKSDEAAMKLIRFEPMLLGFQHARVRDRLQEANITRYSSGLLRYVEETPATQVVSTASVWPPQVRTTSALSFRTTNGLVRDVDMRIALQAGYPMGLQMFDL